MGFFGQKQSTHRLDCLSSNNAQWAVIRNNLLIKKQNQIMQYTEQSPTHNVIRTR